MHALHICCKLSSELGGVCVLMDAINQRAQQFFEKFGIHSFNHSPRTLILPMKVVREYISL